MATKISALPAALAGNLTDASVVPLVDVTVTTVKLTLGQLRTQQSSVAQTFNCGAVNLGITLNGTVATGVYQQFQISGATKGYIGYDAGALISGETGRLALRSDVNKISLAIAAVSMLVVDASAVANDTRLQLWDVTAAALVRVTRGIADSGGVGFRLLRIPN